MTVDYSFKTIGNNYFDVTFDTKPLSAMTINYTDPASRDDHILLIQAIVRMSAMKINYCFFRYS